MGREEAAASARALRDEEAADVAQLERDELERRLDRMVEETFPASDAPSSLPG
jgi:hypothetical protein